VGGAGVARMPGIELCQVPSFSSLDLDDTWPVLPKPRFGDEASALASDDAFYRGLQEELAEIPAGPPRDDLEEAVASLTAAANHLFVQSLERAGAVDWVVLASAQVAGDLLLATRRARASSFDALKHSVYAENPTPTDPRTAAAAWKLIKRAREIREAFSRSFRSALGDLVGMDFPDGKIVGVVHVEDADRVEEAVLGYELGFLPAAEEVLEGLPEDPVKGLLMGAVLKLTAAQSKVERNKVAARSSWPAGLLTSDAVLGDVLHLCHDARQLAFDVLKYDIYHRQPLLSRPARTSPVVKDLAARVIQEANHLEHEELAVVQAETRELLRTVSDATGEALGEEDGEDADGEQAGDRSVLGLDGEPLEQAEDRASLHGMLTRVAQESGVPAPLVAREAVALLGQEHGAVALALALDRLETARMQQDEALLSEELISVLRSLKSARTTAEEVRSETESNEVVSVADWIVEEVIEVSKHFEGLVAANVARMQDLLAADEAPDDEVEADARKQEEEELEDWAENKLLGWHLQTKRSLVGYAADDEAYRQFVARQEAEEEVEQWAEDRLLQSHLENKRSLLDGEYRGVSDEVLADIEEIEQWAEDTVLQWHLAEQRSLVSYATNTSEADAEQEALEISADGETRESGADGDESDVMEL